MTTQQRPAVRRSTSEGRLERPRATNHDGGLATVAERLMAEFEGRIDLFVVTGVVLRSGRDLATV